MSIMQALRVLLSLSLFCMLFTGLPKLGVPDVLASWFAVMTIIVLPVMRIVSIRPGKLFPALFSRFFLGYYVAFPIAAAVLTSMAAAESGPMAVPIWWGLIVLVNAVIFRRLKKNEDEAEVNDVKDGEKDGSGPLKAEDFCTWRGMRENRERLERMARKSGMTEDEISAAVNAIHRINAESARRVEEITSRMFGNSEAVGNDVRT